MLLCPVVFSICLMTWPVVCFSAPAAAPSIAGVCSANEDINDGFETLALRHHGVQRLQLGNVIPDAGEWQAWQHDLQVKAEHLGMSRANARPSTGA